MIFIFNATELRHLQTVVSDNLSLADVNCAVTMLMNILYEAAIPRYLFSFFGIFCRCSIVSIFKFLDCCRTCFTCVVDGVKKLDFIRILCFLRCIRSDLGCDALTKLCRVEPELFFVGKKPCMKVPSNCLKLAGRLPFPDPLFGPCES